MDKAKEVLWMVFPSDEDPTLPLDPGEEAFDEPAPHVSGSAGADLASAACVRFERCGAIISMPS